MKKPKLGTGKRFAVLAAKIAGTGKSMQAAKAIAASIGRKKYGKLRFQKLAIAGKKRK